MNIYNYTAECYASITPNNITFFVKIQQSLPTHNLAFWLDPLIRSIILYLFVPLL